MRDRRYTAAEGSALPRRGSSGKLLIVASTGAQADEHATRSTGLLGGRKRLKGHGGMSANREQAITQDTMVDRYRNLYAKYGRDLMKVKLRAGPCAAKGLSSDMELELAYLRIRDTKPSMVWEWSPNHGLSTIFILAALADNGHGQLIAFDVNENWHDSEACMADQIEGRFRFVQGDVHNTFYEVESEVGMPDYLFLDSWHSHIMGMWYVSEVFPKMSKHTYVSLHDVHNPKFWGDSFDDKAFREGRDLRLRPAWMATEEGMTVLFGQMKVLRFEVWRESTKVTETKYEGPLTREEALGALQAETSLWIGKLTVKYSPDGPRGPRNLDSSETYVLQLAGGPGHRAPSPEPDIQPLIETFADMWQQAAASQPQSSRSLPLMQAEPLGQQMALQN
ncbi:hypothetical protein WJX84_008077 [Apatococcus fuscideae]|uniref:Uncharacterized protein n=1 Tax=Apatococcus fuscideae TaxID=2026836 RepID=A0AAW1TF73_9CHLO